MRASVSGLWGALAAVLGGALWVPYGVLEVLEPWGADVEYRQEVGYSLVTDASRFVGYSLPGGLALVLASIGLLGVIGSLRMWGERGSPAGGVAGGVLACVALALGVVSLAGVVTLNDPLFTAGRVFGTLALGAATCLVGFAARRTGARGEWSRGLLALGLLGMFLLPLWPLVYAVGWVPAAAGAAVIAAFGVGWVLLGVGLWRGRARHAAPGL